jgi:hypothetical protein
VPASRWINGVNTDPLSLLIMTEEFPAQTGDGFDHSSENRRDKNSSLVLTQRAKRKNTRKY